MAGLQRSAVSFRRQGSSGMVWDDKFLSGEFKKKEEHDRQQQQQQQQSDHINNDADVDNNNNNKDVVNVIKPTISIEPISIERSRSNNGNRHHRTGKVVSPTIEPPSPKLSACGFCSAFGKPKKQQQHRRSTRPSGGGKRRSR
ncbi:hypothetical protein ACFE04_014444 [Oxalis oulophora]